MSLHHGNWELLVAVGSAEKLRLVINADTFSALRRPTSPVHELAKQRDPPGGAFQRQIEPGLSNENIIHS